jgi:hypothetical protein
MFRKWLSEEICDKPNTVLSDNARKVEKILIERPIYATDAKNKYSTGYSFILGQMW